ncbi:hypothetical protein TrST_g11386 [Triparma strigata]|uniref:Dipeptidase n=1 Tax=Triparma strigata TaxID=1606541 RepID=A0A9W7AZH4_9STRA|nr:hypothetical protein TrST_g11386 [Triparma strigata]
MRFFSLSILTALAVPSLSLEVFDNMCTTIGVGPGATENGASMVTHTADCDDCDFRLTKTPPQTWEVPSLRPVYRYHRQYPRLVAEERGDTWKKENLETEFKDLYGSKKFVEDQLVGYVPQVEKTFGLFEALFAMMNDQNVAIGESTCASALGKNAVPRECPDCPGPLVDVAAISLIALERCDTARCAVEMMGSLATEYGYYGASTEEGDAGEALTVSDPNEVWMMHLSPDDTGMSAIWIAQRIPHNHVTAAANAFVIRGVDPDNEDMLFSDNIWEVAERSGRAKYDTARAPGLLDFALTFSPDEYAPGMMKKPEYSTDRVWRVFSLLAPSQKFERTNDWLGDNLPLSVEVEKKVTVEDIMALNRDHYEGSDLDLTKGFAAGPFGSPIRYDPGYGPPGQTGTDDPKDNDNGLTKWDRMHGAFPRAIGIMRTSWHFVATSRPNLPNEVAGVMWYSQYQPSAGAYAPLYSSMEKLPEMYTRGSLYEYTEESSFWKFCTVGNYAQLAWKYIYPNIKAKQQELEESFFKAQKEIDEKAVKLVNEGKRDEAIQLLTKFSTDSAETIFDEWGKLLHYLFAKYHDGYTNILDEPEFRAVEFFYPRWWLVMTDYFTNVVNDHFYELPEKGSYDTLDNVFPGDKKNWVLEQLGMGAAAGDVEIGENVEGATGFSTFLVGSVGVVCGLAGYFAGNRKNRGGYTQIADAGMDVRV